jgi:hypothetical protein
VQIGALADPQVSLPAAALRSSGLELLGSGIGASSHVTLVRCVGEVLRAFSPAKFLVDAEAIPLADVESAWNRHTKGRVVFTI